MSKHTTFDQVIIEYYHGIVTFGVLLVALAIWLYEYHYTTTGDEMMGLIAAGSLFLGTILTGQGIRGWRDGEEFRNRFIKVRGRTFENEVTITKKKKKYF